MNINLNEFCSTGGCGAKMDPSTLSDVLKFVPKYKDDNLLVGFGSSDDGAVYKITDDISLVKTLDFFTPIVDDPYTFGQIAAANALSDVYAMGGDPKVCLNIVSFPIELSPEVLIKILQGGGDKVVEAEASLSGGHTINDPSLKYGLSVTGIVDTNKIMQNNNTQIGDVLILTKPLGVGVVMAASRLDDCSEEDYNDAIKYMTQLNKYAAEISRDFPVNAMTDVTGFGLLGHMDEMINNNSISIKYNDIMKISGAEKYAKDFYITAAAQRNRNHLKGKVRLEDLKLYQEEILFDPQTSGGLLISLPKEYGIDLLKKLMDKGLNASIIGEVIEKQDVDIIVS